MLPTLWEYPGHTMIDTDPHVALLRRAMPSVLHWAGLLAIQSFLVLSVRGKATTADEKTLRRFSIFVGLWLKHWSLANDLLACLCSLECITLQRAATCQSTILSLELRAAKTSPGVKTGHLSCQCDSPFSIPFRKPSMEKP